MWYCSKCSEELPEKFHVCWQCGTSRDGIEDPNFEVVIDHKEAPVTEPVRRFSFRSVVAIAVSIILALALLNYGHPVLVSICASVITALFIGMLARGGMRQKIIEAAICFATVLLITLAVTAIAIPFY